MGGPNPFEETVKSYAASYSFSFTHDEFAIRLSPLHRSAAARRIVLFHLPRWLYRRDSWNSSKRPNGRKRSIRSSPPARGGKPCVAAPETMEAQQIAARAAALGAGLFNSAAPDSTELRAGGTQAGNMGSVLLKTADRSRSAMAILLPKNFGWQFAVGIRAADFDPRIGAYHRELGVYGIKQSPPIFLPYVGALIILRQNPRTPSRGGDRIAGPIAGTFGALICYGLIPVYRLPILLT